MYQTKNASSEIISTHCYLSLFSPDVRIKILLLFPRDNFSQIRGWLGNSIRAMCDSDDNDGGVATFMLGVAMDPSPKPLLLEGKKTLLMYNYLDCLVSKSY